MDFDLNQLDDRNALERDAWGVLVAICPEIESTGQNELDRSELFTPGAADRLGQRFLLHHRRGLKANFLVPDQLFSIASEDGKHGTLESHTDIVEAAGLYVIVSICGQCVLKVGQTGNFRERFSNGHLRYGYDATASKLIDFCNAVPDAEES